MRPVVLVVSLLAAVSTAPYVQATLSPPPDRAFEGFFWFSDDGYNYLSFVEQAEAGAFVFRNKLYDVPHRPALVNLEWWLVGTKFPQNFQDFSLPHAYASTHFRV